MRRRTPYRARSTSAIYFAAFWLAMALLTIGVPLLLTRGR